MNTKTLLLAASLSAICIVSAFAREDRGDGRSAIESRSGQAWHAMAMADSRFSLADTAKIEPAAGRGDLAALPDIIATPRTSVPVMSGKQLGTFNSVAISAGRLPAASKWRKVASADYSALFMDQCQEAGLAGCDADFATRLRAARSTAAAASGFDSLSIVNTAVNSVLRYESDRSVWGTGDYWATPVEMATKGSGDCEDFAIAKMWMLRSLGFRPDQLQLVVLEDTRKGIYHAVLAVHSGGARYILDNLNNTVSPDSSYRSYLPVMSFVGTKSYIHGFENRRSDTADSPVDLTQVLPGEGV